MLCFVEMLVVAGACYSFKVSNAHCVTELQSGSKFNRNSFLANRFVSLSLKTNKKYAKWIHKNFYFCEHEKWEKNGKKIKVAENLVFSLLCISCLNLTDAYF